MTSRTEINAKIAAALRKERIEKVCPICSKIFLVYKIHQSKVRAEKKTCSASCGNKLRYSRQEERIKTSKSVKGKTGGWRNFGGNGIKGKYEGYIYQSSWELAWIFYHINKNIKFKRCEKSFPYIFDGKERKYFPDFYLEKENTYIEIKGFPSDKTEAKINAFPKDLKLCILYKNDIIPYIKFMKDAGVV